MGPARYQRLAFVLIALSGLSMAAACDSVAGASGGNVFTPGTPPPTVTPTQTPTQTPSPPPQPSATASVILIVG